MGKGFAQDTVRVFLCGSPPFLLNAHSGVAVELWQQLAIYLPLPYRVVGTGSVPEALQLLKRQQIDLAVGPISITADRERSFDFSHPFMESTLGLATQPPRFSLKHFLASLWQPVLFYAVGGFLAMLTAVGFLFWIVERKKNPDIPPQLLPGLGQGIWLAIATFTTVGYGDIAPRSGIGKVLAATWMIVSLMIASSVVAGLASAMTYVQFQRSPITTVEDLKGRKVGGIAGTSAFAFVQRYGAVPVAADSLETALQWLRTEAVDAVVYDYPQLQYALRQHPDWAITLVKLPVTTEYYACALSQHSPYQEMLNQAVLHALEAGKIAQVLQRWGL